MESPFVYLDHAATTPVRPEVLEVMLPFLGATFGNPSSGHRYGRAARAGLEQARREVAEAAGAEPGQVVFTSGGTESDNLAIIGAALGARRDGRPMVVAVAATEHKAVLAAAHQVSQLGGTALLLPVDSDGGLEVEALDRAIVDRPAVVSAMWVNNETGVIQQIAVVAARCAAAGCAFHTDMVQAAGRIDASFRDPAITFATVSGHKLGAPKGIGALLVRDPARLAPLQQGGSQQRGLRPGTENVAGAVALGRAYQLAMREQAAEAHRLTTLRDRLAAGLRGKIADLRITAESAPRAPHILHLLIPGAESGAMLMHLDLAGLGGSGGSACATGAIEPSHVLGAMGIPQELGVNALRLSLGLETTIDDIEQALTIIPAVVERVRQLSGAMPRG